MPSAKATLAHHRQALDAARPAAALPPGLTISAAAGQDPELYIYDDIGPSWAGMIDGDSVVRALKQLPAGHKRVIVRINSPGGDVFEAFSIYNALVRHPAEIVVEIDALAASAASIIAMAGDKIRIAQNAMVMVHNAWTIAVGDIHDLTQTVELLAKVGENIVATYAARTGLAAEAVQALLDAETWLTADEAIAQKFADEVGQALQVSASIPEGRFRNVPERMKAAIQPAERQTRPEGAAPPTVAAGAAGVETLRQRIAVTRRRLGV